MNDFLNKTVSTVQVRRQGSVYETSFNRLHHNPCVFWTGAYTVGWFKCLIFASSLLGFSSLKIVALLRENCQQQSGGSHRSIYRGLFRRDSRKQVIIRQKQCRCGYFWVFQLQASPSMCSSWSHYVLLVMS